MALIIEDTNEGEELLESGADVRRNSQGWIDIRTNPTGDRFYKLQGIPLKIFDRKALSYMDDTNAHEVIDNIIRKHMRGVSFENLLFPERKWLVFWLRYTSLSDSAYTLPWTCRCGCECEKKILLSDFKIWKPKPELQLTGNVIELKSGSTASFRLQTMSLHAEVEAFVESQRNKFSNSAEELSLMEMATVASLMEEFNGARTAGLDGGSGIDMLEGLSNADYDEIQKYVDETIVGWGISGIVHDVCPKCGGDKGLNVIFRRAFFAS
jgi:hypothetical protein